MLAHAVGGGVGNTIEGRASYSTIGGGIANAIHTNADYATIGGGDSNTCNGSHATIPGGLLNSASGGFSLAAGSRAKANHDGTFVWADFTGADFSSTATNEFAVRATGGVRLVSGVDSNGVPVTGVSLPAGNGSWATLSDRNAKENFAGADTRKILELVAALPIQTWNYKTQDRTVRHLGPMAQDFHATFGVGEDDRHIATVDEGGVTLAAIQGLNQKVEDLKTELNRRDAENAELKRRFEALEEFVREKPAMPSRVN